MRRVGDFNDVGERTALEASAREYRAGEFEPNAEDGNVKDEY